MYIKSKIQMIAEHEREVSDAFNLYKHISENYNVDDVICMDGVPGTKGYFVPNNPCESVEEAHKNFDNCNALYIQTSKRKFTPGIIVESIEQIPDGKPYYIDLSNLTKVNNF